MFNPVYAAFRAQFPTLFTVALLLSSWAPLAYSHAEHDKARYVAEGGVDEGRCDELASPCKTIAYAAKQAGKGDRILVAEGRYEITDVDSIFYLSSSVVPVSGGYQKSTFQKPSAAAHKSILIGVPAQFSQALAEKGFTVIADTKGLNREQQQYLQAKQSQLTAMAQAQTSMPCVQGKAGEFDCNKLDLLAHMPLASLGNGRSNGNDIWGHYDLNDGREYALFGLTNGVSIVEVTDPLNPRRVAFITSQDTVWRDLKTYQYYDDNARRWKSYAYVTADAANVGTMILDLNQLPQTVAVATSEKTDASAHNIYISNVDYSTGVVLPGKTAYMHVAGSDKQGGAFNSYSLADPLKPVAVYKNNAVFPRDWYSHDVSSLWINDERREQCVDKNNNCDVMLDYNENAILLWDKTNNNAPTHLSSTQYANLSYVHSGWWTEDQQFISVHDELDELNSALNTRVRFFSINNLRAPELVGEYIGPTRAIDHNGYSRGNRYYMSNYERGLVVLDITDPRNPKEAGFFDTYPIANSAAFNGAWGVYPYLPSGTILLSDINSGLYLIRDKTFTAQGQVVFSDAHLDAREGDTVSVKLQRLGGNSGAVDVFYETLSGNAQAGGDFINTQGKVEWAAGDSSEKTIDIPIVADGNGDEFSERFFVRLYNPRNGLSLAAPNMMQVVIADKPDEPASSSSSAVAENTSSSSASSVATANPGATKNSGGGGGSVPAGLIAMLLLLAWVKAKRVSYGC